MNREFIYVYGISDHLTSLPDVLEQENLQSFEFDELLIIAKRVSPDEYGENLTGKYSDMPWLETNARHHMQVLSCLMNYRTILPFKFGTIFTTEENLKNFIRTYALQIRENLAKIEGKEEWSVKIYLDRTMLLEKIPKRSEPFKHIDWEISQSTPGKGYILKKKRTELIREEVDNIARISGANCYDELVATCDTVRINQTLPKEVTGRNEEMILNLACFLKKQKSHILPDIIALLKEKNANAGLSFEISGPWPPFNFIEIKMQS